MRSAPSQPWILARKVVSVERPHQHTSYPIAWIARAMDYKLRAQSGSSQAIAARILSLLSIALLSIAHPRQEADGRGP